MTQKSAFPFGAMLPGFEFMQQLASSGSGAVTPGLQHWIAPTVDIEELDRRIQELKTVQFWLEQNLLGVKGTVQALEVQKMTLQTLQGMNLSMGEIAKAFTLPTTNAPDADTPAAATRTDADDAPQPEQDAASEEVDGDRTKAKADTGAAKAPTMVDALQWWGALSQQFQQIATETLQKSAQQATVPAAAARQASGARSGSGGKKATPKKAAAKKTAGKKAAAASSGEGSRSNRSGTAATRKKTAAPKKKKP